MTGQNPLPKLIREKYLLVRKNPRSLQTTSIKIQRSIKMMTKRFMWRAFPKILPRTAFSSYLSNSVTLNTWHYSKMCPILTLLWFLKVRRQHKMSAIWWRAMKNWPSVFSFLKKHKGTLRSRVAWIRKHLLFASSGLTAVLREKHVINSIRLPPRDNPKKPPQQVM